MKSDLTPEQIRALLGAGAKGRSASKESKPQLMWTVFALLIAGLIYLVVRFTAAPSKLTVINASGSEASSVVIVSGDQRIDLGRIGNGEVRKVDLVPGRPLRIEYTFEQRRVWTTAEPVPSFQFMTVSIGPDKKVQIESPSTSRRQR